jgi:hypothetical protein
MTPFILKYRLTQKYKSAGEGGRKKNIFLFGRPKKLFKKSPGFLSWLSGNLCLSFYDKILLIVSYYGVIHLYLLHNTF